MSIESDIGWGSTAAMLLVMLATTAYWHRRWDAQGRFHWEKLTDENFVLSLAVTPRTLMRFRLAASVYTAIVMVAFLILFSYKVMVFFTLWNFFMITCYFAAAAALSVQFVRHVERNPDHSWTGMLGTSQEGPASKTAEAADGAALERGSALQKYVIVDSEKKLPLRALWVLFQVLVPLSMVVAVVYWTLLAPYLPKEEVASFWNVSVHGIQVFLLGAELWLNGHEIVLKSSLIFTSWFVSIFTGFAWLYYSLTNRWIYPFLETGYAASAVVYTLMLGFILGLVWASHRLSRFKVARLGRIESVRAVRAMSISMDHRPSLLVTPTIRRDRQDSYNYDAVDSPLTSLPHTPRGGTPSPASDSKAKSANEAALAQAYDRALAAVQAQSSHEPVMSEPQTEDIASGCQSSASSLPPDSPRDSMRQLPPVITKKRLESSLQPDAELDAHLSTATMPEEVHIYTTDDVV